MNGTLDLASAASRTWGVAVVGAGPAGAMTARAAALSGASVLLLDRARLPRSKVCGCCLNERALAALRRAGLGSLSARLGALPTSEVLLSSGGRAARLPMAGGVSISRQALDVALVDEAVRAGAAFLSEAEARLGEEGEGGRTLQVGGHRIRARVVVAADGLGGRLAARVGLTSEAERGARVGAGAVLECGPGFFEPGRVYMACGPSGYTGLVRLEDGRLDVACAFDATAMRGAGGPAKLAEVCLRAAGWPVPALAEAPWRGTPSLTRRPRAVAAHRLFVAGDAAGYVEPFTGEGMAWAIASGLALGPLAAEAARGWHPELASRWKLEHRRLVASRQWACRALAAALRRPWLVNGLVAVLSWLPQLAWPMMRHLAAPGLEAR
jgi:flavin-dependent dehydrogenase